MDIDGIIILGLHSFIGQIVLFANVTVILFREEIGVNLMVSAKRSKVKLTD